MNAPSSFLLLGLTQLVATSAITSESLALDIVIDSAGTHLEWASNNDWLYEVQSSDDLTQPDWNTLKSWRAGNGSSITETDTESDTQNNRYYRLNILEPGTAEYIAATDSTSLVGEEKRFLTLYSSKAFAYWTSQLQQAQHLIPDQIARNFGFPYFREDDQEFVGKPSGGLRGITSAILLNNIDSASRQKLYELASDQEAGMDEFSGMIAYRDARIGAVDTLYQSLSDPGTLEENRETIMAYATEKSRTEAILGLQHALVFREIYQSIDQSTLDDFSEIIVNHTYLETKDRNSSAVTQEIDENVDPDYEQEFGVLVSKAFTWFAYNDPELISIWPIGKVAQFFSYTFYTYCDRIKSEDGETDGKSAPSELALDQLNPAQTARLIQLVRDTMPLHEQFHALRIQITEEIFFPLRNRATSPSESEIQALVEELNEIGIQMGEIEGQIGYMEAQTYSSIFAEFSDQQKASLTASRATVSEGGDGSDCALP